MSNEHWFIDETKAKGFTFAIVAVDGTDVTRCRTAILRIPRRGQSVLHFKKESDATRARALREIGMLPISVTLVVVSTGVPPIESRKRGVEAVAELAKAKSPRRIVFELDEAALVNDRKWLRAELGPIRVLEYQHVGKGADPMLWIADAMAWAVQRGERWRAQVEHLIVEVIEA